MAFCPNCKKDEVRERHTAFIEPDRDRTLVETYAAIIVALDQQDVSTLTYNIECLSCGAEWTSRSAYLSEVKRAKRKKKA